MDQPAAQRKRKIQKYPSYPYKDYANVFKVVYAHMSTKAHSVQFSYIIVDLGNEGASCIPRRSRRHDIWRRITHHESVATRHHGTAAAIYALVFPSFTSSNVTMSGEARSPIVEIDRLRFTYPGIDGHPPPGSKPLIDDFSISINAGDRCLLVGSNGAGKTTILKILGGKHMVDAGMVRIMGRSAFHDTGLTSSGDLCYLGGEWRRDVAFAGFDVPIQMDISAEKMIFGVSNVDPERREKLIKVLDIDLSWRMHRASDGQRRRVQICMGLLKPFKVLLLDEITVDLDVLARANLLTFLKKDSEERGAAIIYATHIFDGLDDWPSQIIYVAHGKLQSVLPLEKMRELSNLSLMRTVESWLRKEREEDRRLRKERKAKGLPEYDEQIEGSRVTGDPARRVVQAVNNGWAAGRLHSTVAGEENFVFSSNRVLRQ